VSGARVEAVLSFARSEIALALPELERAPRRDGQERVRSAWALSGLRLSSERGPCPGQFGHADFTESDGLMLWLSYECSAPPHVLELALNFLSSASSGHRHLVHFSWALGGADYVLQRNTDVLRIDLPRSVPSSVPQPTKASSWSRSESFFVMGLEHILTGYDHLVFLLGLLLVLGPMRSLFWAISAFTLAHSLTLSLATLGVASPSPRLIEPLIALSIVYVGIENWFVQSATGRWRITFLFGLIHGFGFAGALREVAMPRAELPAALLSFNLGVETGQLAVVALVLPALLFANRRAWLDAKKPRWLSLGVSAAGLFWLVSRLGTFA
jgi:hydrogenase/urease accessory protein HupE